MKRTGSLAVALAAVLAGVHAPAAAQRVDPTRIIDLHVNAEGNGRSFSGSVPEGKGFRMTFTDIGTFELVPVVVDAAQGTFRVTVYRGAEGAETRDLQAVETVSARLGVPVALRSMPSVGLVIEGIRVADAQAGTVAFAGARADLASRFARPALQQDFCCVSCGGVIACACRVNSECGTCCVAPCCRPTETSGPRYLPAPRAFASLAGGCGAPIRDEERVHTGRRPATVLAVR